jgi:hypothetical protein
MHQVARFAMHVNQENFCAILGQVALARTVNPEHLVVLMVARIVNRAVRFVDTSRRSNPPFASNAQRIHTQMKKTKFKALVFNVL